MKQTKDSAAAPATTTNILIPALKLDILEVKLVGLTPLITHAWSAKAKDMMLAKQTKQAAQAKEAKNPQADYESSIYRTAEGEPGMPATAFKQAAVDACSHAYGITKVQARGAFHVLGDILPIHGKPTMREDSVRIGMGTADLRYRAEFKTWAVTLRIRYNTGMLSPAQIINLLNVAGFAIGVGEWRPQRDGTFGTFEVAN